MFNGPEYRELDESQGILGNPSMPESTSTRGQDQTGVQSWKVEAFVREPD